MKTLDTIGRNTLIVTMDGYRINGVLVYLRGCDARTSTFEYHRVMTHPVSKQKIFVFVKTNKEDPSVYQYYYYNPSINCSGRVRLFSSESYRQALEYDNDINQQEE